MALRHKNMTLGDMSHRRATDEIDSPGFSALSFCEQSALLLHRVATPTARLGGFQIDSIRHDCLLAEWNDVRNHLNDGL